MTVTTDGIKVTSNGVVWESNPIKHVTMSLANRQVIDGSPAKRLVVLVSEVHNLAVAADEAARASIVFDEAARLPITATANWLDIDVAPAAWMAAPSPARRTNISISSAHH